MSSDCPSHQVELVQSAEAVSSAATLGSRFDETLGATVGLAPADGHKCERCWNYCPSVGASATYAGVCERCDSALTIMGFPPVQTVSAPPAAEAPAAAAAAAAKAPAEAAPTAAAGEALVGAKAAPMLFSWLSASAIVAKAGLSPANANLLTPAALAAKAGIVVKTSVSEESASAAPAVEPAAAPHAQEVAVHAPARQSPSELAAEEAEAAALDAEAAADEAEAAAAAAEAAAASVPTQRVKDVVKVSSSASSASSVVSPTLTQARTRAETSASKASKARSLAQKKRAAAKTAREAFESAKHAAAVAASALGA
jgi:hypothetical protein